MRRAVRAPLRARPGRPPSGARSSVRPRRRRGRRASIRRGALRPARDTLPRRRRDRARSAATRLRVSGSSTASTRASSPARTWTASAPWPASGRISAGSNRCPTSAARPRRSSPQAARTTASRFRSPRLRSRVSMFPRKGSIESVGSSASSWARRRAEAVPMRIPGRSSDRAAERVARVVAHEVGADGQPGRVTRGHVLRGVDGGVDPPVEQGLLELLDEDAAVADLAEGATSVAVAGGRDRHERDLPPRGTEPLGDQRGLRQREPAAAGAEPEKHYSSGSRRSNR